MNIDPYVEYLQYRLKHEESGHVRKYIRAKLRILLGKTARVKKPTNDGG